MEEEKERKKAQTIYLREFIYFYSRFTFFLLLLFSDTLLKLMAKSNVKNLFCIGLMLNHYFREVNSEQNSVYFFLFLSCCFLRAFHIFSLLVLFFFIFVCLFSVFRLYINFVFLLFRSSFVFSRIEKPFYRILFGLHVRACSILPYIS